MRRIGIDKRDPEYKHFYFYDEKVLTSNPPKYEVHYVDEELGMDYIECSNVIKIKDAPLDNEVETKSVTLEVDENKDITITLPESDVKEPKKRGRKKKVVEESKTIPNQLPEVEERKSFDFSSIFNAKFEYKIFDIDFSSSGELEDLLNEYGDDGWELCGTELYNEGLIFDKKKIFCIMKKIKGLE